MNNKFSWLAICILSLAFSCKKSGKDNAVNDYTIKVIEYKTNVALPAVKVSLYKCSNYDPVFGCRSKALYKTLLTDNNGEYTLTQGDLNNADEGIILSKAQYWDNGGGGGTGEFFMEPQAWVDIKIKTSKTYPDTSLFDLQTSGEAGSVGSLSFKAPIDSVIHFRLFGNEINKVKWVVYTALPNCQFYCPRDTLAFDSLSFQPQKFETLSGSINY